MPPRQKRRQNSTAEKRVVEALSFTRQSPTVTSHALRRDQENRLTCRTSASSVTAQHAVHQVAQRPPIILPTRQLVLIDEEDIVFETSVQVGFEAQVHHDGVVMTINVGVDAVQTLEDLSQ